MLKTLCFTRSATESYSARQSKPLNLIIFVLKALGCVIAINRSIQWRIAKGGGGGGWEVGEVQFPLNRKHDFFDAMT